MKPEVHNGWPGAPARLPLLVTAPWLGSELTPDEWREASGSVFVPGLSVPADRKLPTIPSDLLGLVITDGHLAARLQVSGYATTAILGSGDMVCACDLQGPQGSMPDARGVLALTNAELIAVDHRLLASCLRWPALGRALLETLTARLRVSSLALALHQSPRVEERLWLALWQLADRFGRVSPSGAVVTLPRVTHSLLAEVVAARRPSVTSAMKRLSDSGLIEVTGRHRWLLRQQPEEGLRTLGLQHELVASLAR